MKKICKTCKIEKDLSEFHNCKKGKMKRKSSCKKCMNAKRKNYYEENKDKAKEYHISNRDTILEKKKENRVVNKEKTNNIIRDIFNMNNKDNLYITYIIKTAEFYKIGYTTNLYNRINTSLKSSINIEDIYILNKNIERTLLKRYYDFKYDTEIIFGGKTECFKFTDDMFNFIIKSHNFKLFKV